MPPLTPRQRSARLGIIALSALLLALPILKSLNPSLHGLPCGFKALTGLPCLFCGGTRAACAALQGDFARSLYLNSLALPVLVFLLLLTLFSAVEIARNRPCADWLMLSKPLLRLWPAWIILLLAWWAMHLLSALRTPKPELIRPDHPVTTSLRNRPG